MIKSTNLEIPIMSVSSFFFLFLFSFLTGFRASAEEIDNTPLFYICPNTSTYSRNSTYFTNLQTLLSSLSSPNASYSTGFQTATTGQDPDRVTGLFLCRGDLSSEVCRRCVDLAVKDTIRLCPTEREVTFYYDKCMLRYSNKNILSTVSTGEGRVLANVQNVTSNERERFRELVMSTINPAAEAASKSPRRFDARKANITTYPGLYVLVQCTPDLKSQECLMCLQQSINQLPTHRIGGRYMMQSCNSRFEQYVFFDESKNLD